MVEKIIAVQTDWGGEYEKLNSFFTKIGVSHLVSCPHAHQQNGSAERKHRHIVEVGLSLLAHAHMPLKFWDEAFLAATYLINRIPSKVINYETPLERLYRLNRITSPSVCSVVLVGQTFDHITNTSLPSDPKNALFWDTAIYTRDSNV